MNLISKLCITNPFLLGGGTLAVLTTAGLTVWSLLAGGFSIGTSGTGSQFELSDSICANFAISFAWSER